MWINIPDFQTTLTRLHQELIEIAGPRPWDPAWFELETHDGLSNDSRRRRVLPHPVR